MARPPRIPEWLDRALDMWVSGATSYDIAAEIGVAQSTVSKQISKARNEADRLRMQQVLDLARQACCEAGGAQPADKDTTQSGTDLRDSRPFGHSATMNPDI
mgnify:CR=1 FL=1